MEKEPISRIEQTKDARLILLSGAVIGTIGAIVEGRLLSNTTLDMDAAIQILEATLAGVTIGATGGLRLITLSRSSKKGS